MWSAGQHAGVAPELQSASLLHTTQLPAWQNREIAGHCESLVHSTHPRVGSHC